MRDIYTTKYLTTLQYAEAYDILAEEFPDHKYTAFSYYEWVRFAFIKHELAGIITAQRYLPGKALVADIVVPKKHRSKGVGIVLLRDLGEELMHDGYTHLMGFTPKTCVEALNTYKRVKTKQTDQVVTCSELAESVPHIDRMIDRIKTIQSRRKK